MSTIDRGVDIVDKMYKSLMSSINQLVSKYNTVKVDITILGHGTGS